MQECRCSGPQPVQLCRAMARPGTIGTSPGTSLPCRTGDPGPSAQMTLTTAAARGARSTQATLAHAATMVLSILVEVRLPCWQERVYLVAGRACGNTRSGGGMHSLLALPATVSSTVCPTAAWLCAQQRPAGSEEVTCWLQVKVATSLALASAASPRKRQQLPI